jgi:hypothetical protein
MKIETKSVHRVDYGDLESKIQEVYGITYEMACDIECGNDTSHEFDGITKETAEKAAADKWDGADFQEWKDGNGKKKLWGPRLILLDMVRQDIIPEGDYVVSVSW